MDPTCGLVEKVRDFVLDLIWEQLLYLIHYHRNIEELNERLVDLTLKRNSIEHQVDVAKNNVEQIEEEVLRWLHKVHEISEQAQQLTKESQAKTECSITSCPNPRLRSKLSKRAEAVTQQVVEICRNGNFNRVSYRVPPQSMLELTNTESNEGIGSRVLIMNQIMEALRNPSVNMIGLCGPGGVCKTTIAKEVAKEVKNQNIFEKVIMATVSEELNVEKIQDQIAEKLGMQLNEKTEDVRTSKLSERLNQENNMLLILDNLWQELDLGKVGIPFVDVDNYSKKNEGRKILLTSRNKTLLSDLMKCQKIIDVGVLLEDEAWELFKRIAELSLDSSSPEMISIATDIVRKCGGLPLAIATAAKALRKKGLNEWENARARLNNPLGRNITGIKEVDPIVRLSYDRLSSENKNIFLLTAMLSHDPSIEDLFMHSVGLGIFQGIENMEQAYVETSVAVSKLKSLNLFLDSISSHHVTIHDVFQDIALSIASDQLHALILRHKSLKEWPDEDELEGCKGICLEESDISVDRTEELHAPTLEFFLLHNTKQHDLTIPSMFFKSSKKLKLLAFTDVRFSSLPSLSFLLKLNTLCLHSCLLEDITEVTRLKNLKVLSLAYSEIEWLPIQLAELTSLQMLNLSHCSKLKVIPPKLLSSLKKLEVLYMGNSFNQWKIEGSSEANENASLQELKDLPISSLDIHIPNVSMLPEALFLDLNLKRYRIFIGEHWKRQDNWKWQDNYETSKILKLELEGSIHLKRGVQKLMKGAEDLYLYGSNGLENVLPCHDGRAFPHLRHLQIESDDTIRYIVLNSAQHEAATNNISNKMSELLFNKVLLPKLERLELSNSINLIPMVWDDQLSHTSFSNLKILIVKNCGFVKLVSLRVLKSLNNLEELEVRECNMLELVFDFEDLNDYKGEAELSSMIVPLKKLTLCGLQKLKNVWSNHYEGDVSFPSLRSVRVSACKSLTSLFPASIAKGMLRDLEYLQIEDCGIEAIVAKDQVSESVATVLEFSRLTSLELSWLQNLKSFYPQRHTLEWPQLQQLDVTYCDELEIFEKEVSSSLEIHEEESTLASKYPLLSHDKVTHNLEELTLRGKGVEMIGSGQLSTYRFPKVKLLSLDVGYDEATTISYKLLLKSFPNLEELTLRGQIKKASGGDDVPLPIKLTRQYLQYHKLGATLSFFTKSHTSARGMEGEDDDDEEVVFSKLQHLKVERLPELKRFCRYNYTFRFPLLDQLIITECPRFKVFSPGLIDTPSLKSIQVSQKMGEKHHEIWDTSLNKTFDQQIFVALREMVLDEDDVSMIRNDQFPADCFAQMEILGIVGFNDEGAAFPHTLLERFPRLTELRVKDSSFEEIFPSPVVHQIQQLHNLTVLKVFQCHQLIYLMTNSAAKSLVNLETLEIDDCKKMEKIVKNENNDDVEGGITFSALRRLKRSSLPRLKAEEHKTDFNIEDPATNNHKVSFPELEILELSYLNSLIPRIWDDKLPHHSLSNLKTLTVSCCGFVKLVPLHVLKSLNNLQELEVRGCNMLETVFDFEDLNDYKEMVSSSVIVPLKKLRLWYLPKLKNVLGNNDRQGEINLVSSLDGSCHQIEELITKQKKEDNEDKKIIFSKLEFLELDELPRLKRFCSQNYTFQFPLLQHAIVSECPQLTIFCSGAIHARYFKRFKRRLHMDLT
ncbi:disease resistance protein At4g27190-like [Neltuma alba]|uniref:disease resistance protein At4g27190-like n=1 Tax=Neltuma alba TaxID=207710 RepID=UPI0010A350B2|nr:disease resistance protein At4g27190-like [Prosopis alba]